MPYINTLNKVFIKLKKENLEIFERTNVQF
jgi:hypothetical protein